MAVELGVAVGAVGVAVGSALGPAQATIEDASSPMITTVEAVRFGIPCLPSLRAIVPWSMSKIKRNGYSELCAGPAPSDDGAPGLSFPDS